MGKIILGEGQQFEAAWLKKLIEFVQLEGCDNAFEVCRRIVIRMECNDNLVFKPVHDHVGPPRDTHMLVLVILSHFLLRAYYRHSPANVEKIQTDHNDYLTKRRRAYTFLEVSLKQPW